MLKTLPIDSVICLRWCLDLIEKKSTFFQTAMTIND